MNAYTVTFIGRKAGILASCDYIPAIAEATNEAGVSAAVAAMGYQLTALMEVRKR